MTVTPAGYESLQTRDWTIPQGADTSNPLRYGTRTGDTTTYPDLTDGWSARAQIRNKVGGDVWASFTSDAVTGARIELAADGYFTLVLPHDVTEAVAWDKRSNGVYDVELIAPDGRVIRHTSGAVTVSHDVTRTP